MIKKYYNKIKENGIVNCIKYFIIQLKKECQLKKIKKNISNPKKIKNIDNYISKMNFFYNISNKPKIKDFYTKNKKIELKILKDASKILKHKFDLLGSGIVELDENIRWNQDFKSGFIWENEFYKNIKIIDLDNNADIKVPWELSRFQHLFTLGKAYWITDDSRYYEESKKEILDWIEKNPVYYSVNWTCAMDVAIRAVNLIFFYFLFEDFIIQDKNFLKKLNEIFYLHGEHIYNNLEKNLGLSNNHYLSNLVGLLFLSIYFKDARINKVKKWLKYSIKELEKEMLIQNNIDGTNYETSTSYHRLVLELMFYSALLLKKNNLSFTDEYEKRLKKMFEFLAKITKSNGKIPLIGDVDNGRLVILSNYYDWEVNDARSIISLGGEYFNNKFLKEVGSSELEDKIWIFGAKNIYQEKFSKESKKFENGGYYLLQNNEIYCLIRCGELSLRGQGGHSHNDQLSIELNIDGEDFFVDTGTGVYTADKNIRNLFRSTEMHNTVSVPNIEQNKFEINELFKMQEETFGKCLEFTNTNFKGIHYGYINKICCLHIREIILEERSLKLTDLLENNNGIVNFNLSPEVNIIKKGKDSIILEKNNIRLKIFIDSKSYEIQDSIVSKKYGKIEKNKKIKIYFENKSVIRVEVE
jgi:heparinase II/III-like protein